MKLHFETKLKKLKSTTIHVYFHLCSYFASIWFGQISFEKVKNHKSATNPQNELCIHCLWRFSRHHCLNGWLVSRFWQIFTTLGSSTAKLLAIWIRSLISCIVLQRTVWKLSVLGNGLVITIKDNSLNLLTSSLPTFEQVKAVHFYCCQLVMGTLCQTHVELAECRSKGICYYLIQVPCSIW
jgi:hypothetical protein